MSDLQKNVLIVDDDVSVLTLLQKVALSNGLTATTVTCGDDALKLLERSNFDLIVLDINMPGMNGFDFVKILRSQKNSIPIMIVSGRRDELDTLFGLELGADDYIAKPFNPVVLGAKMKALIRRANSSCANEEPTIITAGPFTYNTSTLRFYKNNEEIVLSAKENALMKLFLDNINRVFPKEVLYELVWDQAIISDNTILVYINRLRQKIEENPSSPVYLQTVRGMGYRFGVGAGS